ncbi:hypothetical protein B0T22DRAFT_122182 [Podospora appendiculata]|uniref:Uncharacterized protein n=1 Tax=Podospora appendiculata TaxID=314037 RepID=A0AAE0X7P9_9PEZI|nr:hypothetical protein B0T22DRAFT_122182 [Podospora appendiculata]
MDGTHRCTCLASFPTEVALQSHLNDYKTQIDFHSTRLNDCRTHSSVNDLDGAESDDVSVSDCDDPDKTIKYCPHPSCSPSKIFQKGQGLRRHFATHVECNEICVFCHKVHKIASEFIRHVKYYHLDEHGTKATYMRTMSQELNNEVVRQLYRSKRACMKKRRLEGGDAGPETPQARRVRLDEGMATADPALVTTLIDQHSLSSLRLVTSQSLLSTAFRTLWHENFAIGPTTMMPWSPL